jgi:putative acetyltransferase
MNSNLFPADTTNLHLYEPEFTDYPELITLWEASVRATHDFLSEDDIKTYKHLIYSEYFDTVDLYSLKANDRILGFLGLSGDSIQMLFIHPDARGQGIGKLLIQFSREEKDIKKVDVNEQNEQALGFYKHMGFTVTGRSAADAAGKPYPVLTMELP